MVPVTGEFCFEFAINIIIKNIPRSAEMSYKITLRLKKKKII